MVGPEDVHQRHEEARLREAEARQRRLAARLVPRLLLGGGVGISGIDSQESPRGDEIITVAGLAATLGARMYFKPFVGVDFKVTGLVGEAAISEDSSGNPNLDETDAWDVSVQAGPVFVPFWRLYLGPLVAVHYRHFDREVLAGRSRLYDLHPGQHTSIGGQVGLGLLNREQLDINLQLAIDEKGQADFLLSAAFHFLLGQ
jgi:hypothetical protein